MPIVNTQGPHAVADNVRLAGQENDGASAVGQRLGQGGTLGDGQGRGRVDAALGDGGAVDGLDFTFVALDDGEVARGEERFDSIAAD